MNNINASFDKKNEIFVSNIGIEVSQETLTQHFEPFGKIAKVKILKKDGRPTGRAYVEYVNEENARTAIKEMNIKTIGGK